MTKLWSTVFYLWITVLSLQLQLCFLSKIHCLYGFTKIFNFLLSVLTSSNLNFIFFTRELCNFMKYLYTMHLRMSYYGSQLTKVQKILNETKHLISDTVKSINDYHFCRKQQELKFQFFQIIDFNLYLLYIVIEIRIEQNII